MFGISEQLELMATAEYKKYQVQTLSPVEEEYLENTKNLHNTVKKKRRSNNTELYFYTSDYERHRSVGSMHLVEGNTFRRN